MKKLFLTVVLSFLAVGVFAQKKVLKEAEKALRKGEIDNAITNATQASQDAETKVDALVLLGDIYQEKFLTGGLTNMEDAQKSFDWYMKAMEVADDKVKEDLMQEAILNPADDTKAMGGSKLGALEAVLLNESNKAMEAEDYERAYKCLKIVTQINSDITKDFFAGYSAENAGMDDEAVAYYKKVIASEEDYDNKSYAYNQVITNLIDNENYDEGLKVLRAAKEEYPEEKLYPQWEVDVLIKIDQMDEAIEGLESLIAQGDVEKNIYYMLSYLQWNNEDFDDALVNAKKALEMDPNYPEALYVAGSVVYNQGAELMSKANNEVDDDAKYQELKKQAMDKFKEAQPYFEKAIEADPNDVYSLRPLSTIYDQLGMDDKRDAILDRLDALEGGN